MKSSSVPFLVAAALLGPACSLVTVPVKVAGGIVETTVKTTGDVVSAPFKAIGGRNKNERNDTNDQEKQQGSEPASTEGKESKN